MDNRTKDKNYVKRTSAGTWEEISTKFQGCYVLSLDGTNARGEAVNVFTQQFVDSQTEDYMLVGSTVIRKNVDLSLTFICGTRYGALDVQQVHDEFVDYITANGDFYIKSKYTEKEAHVVCQEGYKPTMVKLHRGVDGSYIIGTIKLHTLDMPQDSQPEPVVGDLYIGFGCSNISNPQSLTNVQHFNTSNPVGSYQIVCPSTSYLWICFQGEIQGVEANGFEVPVTQQTPIGELRCYRTDHAIVPHTMSFNIIS